MSNVHGWTALAGAVVALAGGATTAQAAPRPQQKQQPKPVLAVGASRYGSWRLEGRELTVRLRGGIAPRSSAARVSIVARCGDGVVENGAAADEAATFGRLPAFAVRGERRARVTPGATTLRLSLSRDVAARATWCGFEFDGRFGATTTAAWMTRRRGSVPRCEHIAAERTIYETQDVSVFARPVDEDDTYSSELLRACRRPAGRSVGLAENWAGGGGGSGTNDNFSARGRWLAWVSAYRPNNPDSRGSAHVVLRDLAGPVNAIGTVFEIGSERGVYPTASVATVTNDGRVVWLASTRATDQDAGSYVRVASLHVGAPGGRSVELDRTAAGGFIEGVFLSADGETLTRYNGETRKSAPLPLGDR